MSECAQVVPPFRPAQLTVTLFFISSLRTVRPIHDVRRSFDCLRCIAYSNLFTLFYVSSAAAAESLKLSLPRRDKDNSNHAVLDERGVRRCDSRYGLHDDDDDDDEAA